MNKPNQKINSENFPSLDFLGSYTSAVQMPNDRGEVCLLGRSNSGKSTLISALAKNPSLVRTSSKPGSTRTVNLYAWQNLYLADLPGFGYAAASHSLRHSLSEQIFDYLKKKENLRAGFLLLDCKRKPQEEEFYISSLFKEKNLPLLLLLTKTDRLNQSEWASLRKKTAALQNDFHLVVEISARKKTNLKILFDFLASV